MCSNSADVGIWWVIILALTVRAQSDAESACASSYRLGCLDVLLGDVNQRATMIQEMLWYFLST